MDTALWLSLAAMLIVPIALAEYIRRRDGRDQAARKRALMERLDELDK